MIFVSAGGAGGGESGGESPGPGQLSSLFKFRSRSAAEAPESDAVPQCRGAKVPQCRSAATVPQCHGHRVMVG